MDGQAAGASGAHAAFDPAGGHNTVNAEAQRRVAAGKAAKPGDRVPTTAGQQLPAGAGELQAEAASELFTGIAATFGEAWITKPAERFDLRGRDAASSSAKSHASDDGGAKAAGR